MQSANTNEFGYGLQPLIHASNFDPEFREVIYKRVHEPAFAAMTPEAFAAYVGSTFVDEHFRFDAAKKRFMSHLPYLEEKAVRIKAAGSPPCDSAEYDAIYTDRQSDVWTSHVAAYKKRHQEAIAAAAERPA